MIQFIKEFINMLVDAYMHVGKSRFGSAKDTLKAMDANGIEKAVLVHGPFHPDIEAFNDARELSADRLRCIGVPLAKWQGSREQNHDLVDLMIEVGVIGFRIQGDEYFDNDGE